MALPSSPRQSKPAFFSDTWAFQMRWPSSIGLKDVIPALGEGQYQETVAEFAQQEELMINVDGSGEMFFQSAGTGCAGNGTLAPHPSSTFLLYDATLTIESCTGGYGYLNGGIRRPRCPFDGEWSA